MMTGGLERQSSFTWFSLDAPCRNLVNKEWEQSHKRGFRCTFERGIMHVYFNFLRTRYRR
jgi:hypothetical protein